MDRFDLAQQIVKSIRDAENNDRWELALRLRRDLEDLNREFAQDGFAPVEV